MWEPTGNERTCSRLLAKVSYERDQAQLLERKLEILSVVASLSKPPCLATVAAYFSQILDRLLDGLTAAHQPLRSLELCEGLFGRNELAVSPLQSLANLLTQQLELQTLVLLEGGSRHNDSHGPPILGNGDGLALCLVEQGAEVGLGIVGRDGIHARLLAFLIILVAWGCSGCHSGWSAILPASVNDPHLKMVEPISPG